MNSPSRPPSEDAGPTPYTPKQLDKIEAQLAAWDATGEANVGISSDCARRLLAMARTSGSAGREAPSEAKLEETARWLMELRSRHAKGPLTGAHAESLLATAERLLASLRASSSAPDREAPSGEHTSGTFLSADRCPEHGFAALTVFSVNEEGIGGGTRLLGPKSCCSRRVEQMRWPVTPTELREVASALMAEARTVEPGVAPRPTAFDEQEWSEIEVLATLTNDDWTTRLCRELVRLRTARSLPDTGAAPPSASGAEEFAEWFVKNYPPLTIISDPSWHAPKILRAAVRCSMVGQFRAAFPAAPSSVPAHAEPTSGDLHPYFGCFTGDCPHETQPECVAAIRAEVANLERAVERLSTAEEAIIAALGVEWDAIRKCWWLPAEPQPVECATLADAIRETQRLAENDVRAAQVSGDSDETARDAARWRAVANAAYIASIGMTGPYYLSTTELGFELCPSITQFADALVVRSSTPSLGGA